MRWLMNGGSSSNNNNMNVNVNTGGLLETGVPVINKTQTTTGSVCATRVWQDGLAALPHANATAEEVSSFSVEGEGVMR